MLAYVNFVPIGTGEEMKELLAKAMKIIHKSELDYQLTSMGVIIEGDWNEIMTLAKKCHDEIMNFAERMSTTITVDDRKDMTERLKKNVLEIEYAIGGALKTGGLT
ncbi:MTH1187 family thiamine-binding protein [candidate division KSB1 bacterium]|nr:MTH1187 family thiamine-binding protein [candidate division KSB1 bacterium]NIR72566.1 MTH1187 family thiamine-binding protein [candidate division KSB1 bacterium]NIS27318.1 MTH1187 family thiamine-binding protein [candidate division KSB1 bacterium]NIT73528.1 MTH1187 family thiamine-binding protein [candidate division KSB1 bacterium]NIU28048.1 MTH1187 family thiamine-binding protein [candidate division KSB1 bacterium]